MRRVILITLTTAGWAALVLLAVGYLHPRTWDVEITRRHVLGIRPHHGRLLLAWWELVGDSDWPACEDLWFTRAADSTGRTPDLTSAGNFHPVSAPEGKDIRTISLLSAAEGGKWPDQTRGWRGKISVGRTDSLSGCSVHFAEVSLWLASGPLLLWPAAALVLYGLRRRRARRQGRCTNCGYDLRGSPSDHCTECGRPWAQQNPARPSAGSL
jgi:hypothetical protein